LDNKAAFARQSSGAASGVAPFFVKRISRKPGMMCGNVEYIYGHPYPMEQVNI
jgi:hypothetical protein